MLERIDRIVESFHRGFLRVLAIGVLALAIGGIEALTGQGVAWWSGRVYEWDKDWFVSFVGWFFILWYWKVVFWLMGVRSSAEGES